MREAAGVRMRSLSAYPLQLPGLHTSDPEQALRYRKPSEGRY